MRPVARRTVLAALGAVPLAAAVPAPIARTLGQFVADRAAQDLFSGTVLLARHGRPLLSVAHGQADRARPAANAVGTVFNLASVSKCFVGVAVAQLVAAGRLSLQDTLAGHLDGFADAGAATVHQLLTHTSGIGRPALGSGPPGPAWNSFAEAMDATLAIIRQTPPQFPPGTRFAYSNDGYWLLGAIVQRVSGEPFDAYVQRHIFAPAGMRDAGFPGLPSAVADPAVARPYWTQRDGTRADFTASPYATFTNGPAGGAYASAPSLLAFSRALATLVRPVFAGLFSTAKYPLAPTDLTAASHGYGYGFEDDIVGSRRLFGHSGSGPGAATRLDVGPDGDWTLIVLSNYDTTIAPIVNLARRLITGAAS